MNFIIKNIYKYNDGTDKYCVYLGDSDNSHEIFVAEIADVDESRTYIKMKNGMNKVLFIDKLLFIDPANVISPLYIKGSIVTISAFEFHSLLNSLCTKVLTQYSANIINLSNQNYDSNSDTIVDTSFSEKILRLLIWNDKKRKLKFDNGHFVRNIYKYNVYFAYMGCNIGCEIEKLRPVLIWKEHINASNKNENSYYVFPISSKIPKKKYYYNVEVDINGQKNIIKINDGKRISIKRIVKPLKISKNQTFKIDDNTKQEIKNAIKMYFSI